MLDKLEAIKNRFDEVSEALVSPDVMSDMKKYASLNKEYKELNRIVIKYLEYKNLLDNIESSKKVLATEKDQDFREMAKEELELLNPQKEVIEEEIKQLLIPKDPNDSKNIIIEVRAGAGGDEAAIFAGDVFRMYQRFAERQNWKMDIIDYTEGSSGGYKEVIANVAGDDVYGKMKYESGVHRVQRVPNTETQGRVHTSAASVAVLPEMDEVEVEIDLNDVRKDTFCSSGPGGQSVNTTYSAIRLTHIPSGLVVQCQDEKSQIKNFDKALKVLRSRLYELELKKHNETVGAQRREMVGSGDRSDKIRTYNYPQGRVTDHRIGYTVYNLPVVMDGALNNFIEELRLAENAQRLQEGVREES
ncbi:MAG: peptide chain release factor 1 [Cytophagaceae bacterium]|nr:peptide chain release factor 1 [Cytophagaceae bacterium]